MAEAERVEQARRRIDGHDSDGAASQGRTECEGGADRRLADATGTEAHDEPMRAESRVGDGFMSGPSMRRQATRLRANRFRADGSRSDFVQAEGGFVNERKFGHRHSRSLEFAARAEGEFGEFATALRELRSPSAELELRDVGGGEERGWDAVEDRADASDAEFAQCGRGFEGLAQSQLFRA